MLKFSLISGTVRAYADAAPAKSGAGRSNPEFTRAHNRAQCGFFVCEALLHLSMVGRVGQPKGWPGSLVTGIATPARLTTNERSNSGGELSESTREAAAMATSAHPHSVRVSAPEVRHA